MGNKSVLEKVADAVFFNPIERAAERTVDSICNIVDGKGSVRDVVRVGGAVTRVAGVDLDTDCGDHK